MSVVVLAVLIPEPGGDHATAVRVAGVDARGTKCPPQQSGVPESEEQRVLTQVFQSSASQAARRERARCGRWARRSRAHGDGGGCGEVSD